MLEAHDQHPVRMSVRFQYGEQIVASLVGRETVAWDELALTRFAGHRDYAACAAVCWLMLASYSTGVR
jgi:hypothetical protein